MKNQIPQKLHPINNPMAEHIGQFCVVEYHKPLFPGVILDVDEDSVYVKMMHQISFFWLMMDDSIWYMLDKVITIIPEPQPVTKCHM